MRLIDADTVSAILTRLIEEQKKSHNLDEAIGLMEARTEINNAPTVPQWINVYGVQTIDTAPVIHAQWMSCEYEIGEGSNTYKCSHCGEVQVLIDGTPKDNGWRYCPNCGAKMDS